jgi:HK97 family phage major capsid protein
MTITYTRDEAVQRMQTIHERMETLGAKHRLSKADGVEFDEAAAEFDQLTRHVENLDRAAAIAGVARGNGGTLRTERGSTQPFTTGPSTGQRDAAMRQLERSVQAATLTDAGATVVERLLDDGPDPERSWAQRWVTDTGDDDYIRAFAKLVAYGETRGGLEFNQAERTAFDRVTRLKAEQRAMGEGAGNTGAYLVPFQLDPSIILTSGGSSNPLFSVARVVSTVSNVWHGVSSDGVTAEWLPEAAEAADASPTLAEPQIPAWKLSAFVQYSVELEGDAVNLVSELGRLLTDAQDQLLASALTVGSGTNQPQGIVTGLAAASGSKVSTTTGATMVAGDLYMLQNALPPRWQANAQWAASLALLNTARQFTTPNGSLTFPGLQQVPPVLLGRSVNEASNMDNTVAAGKNLAIYGDFQNYVITQRVGSAVEFVPHILGTNRRPTGQRGLWLWSRWGGGVVNPNGFRLLTA